MISMACSTPFAVISFLLSLSIFKSSAKIEASFSSSVKSNCKARLAVLNRPLAFIHGPNTKPM
ncbi:secreted protein [gut metagenome]|uniref:Secreted protein n=1 Tax=gut metagenome TaxID=749906 RepID=J9FQ06_9ZZZZ